MAFMKFYVGNEANASSHRDGIYIAIDTKKIFYNGDAYGGSEVDLSNYYTIDQVDGKIGTNTYTGANYISKETNLTDAVLQLDEEIKATNDNLTLDHTNAEATYAKKTDLSGYLPLSGGTMSGDIILDTLSCIHFSEPPDAYSTTEIFLGQIIGEGPRFSFRCDTWRLEVSILDGRPRLLIQEKTGRSTNTYLGIHYDGITLYRKNATDLLNAGGSTTSISKIVSQVQAAIVDSAPETLDTLKELADALGNDPNFATTVTNQIASKQDKLVSGTNIKTINGQTLLGSGDITTPTPTVNAASGTKTIWTGTSSEYEAVSPKDANTLYFITEE